MNGSNKSLPGRRMRPFQSGKHMTVAGERDTGQRKPRQSASHYCKIKYDGRDARRSCAGLSGVDSQAPISFRVGCTFHSKSSVRKSGGSLRNQDQEKRTMAVGAKIAKTADRKKVMDTSKSTDCPKCGKSTRIVKRMKDRQRGVPGGIYISCSACEFFEKL